MFAMALNALSEYISLLLSAVKTRSPKQVLSMLYRKKLHGTRSGESDCSWIVFELFKRLISPKYYSLLRVWECQGQLYQQTKILTNSKRSNESTTSLLIYKCSKATCKLMLLCLLYNGKNCKLKI